MKEISYLSAPIHVWWDITQRCNFKCKHCYSNSQYHADDELSTQEIFKIIGELKDAQIGYVYILGGEPFIRPDFEDILKKFSDSKIPLMVNTNGWFINEGWSKKIALSSVRHLRFSLDGASPSTHDEFRGMKGSFDRVVNGIRLCREMNVPIISCSYTITSKNYNEIEETCKLLAQLKVDNIQFGPISQTGRAVECPELHLKASESMKITSIIGDCIKQYGDRINIYSVDGTYDKPFTRLVKKGLMVPDFMGCQAGRTRCCIDWKGNVIPCLLWRDNIAGSLREESFKHIWDNSSFFRELRRPRGDQHSECKDCIYSDVCARECPRSPSQIEYRSDERLMKIDTMRNKIQEIRPCSNICNF